MGKVTSQNILDGIVVRFDDIVLFEAITPEQKERGQREINKKALDPFFKIREYLQEKFKNPKTKEDFRKRNEEYSRYNFVIRCLQEAKKGSETVNKKGRLDAEKYVESFDLNNAILIGKNTIQAMTNGVYYMTVEGILGICRRIENELGYHLKKILTGGNAIYFKNELSSFFYDPNFTLKGINYIYDINRE